MFLQKRRCGVVFLCLFDETILLLLLLMVTFLKSIFFIIFKRPRHESHFFEYLLG